MPSATVWTDSVTGPASYAAGGFTVTTSLASVDAAMATVSVRGVNLRGFTPVITRNSPSAGSFRVQIMRRLYDKLTALGDPTGLPVGVSNRTTSGGTYDNEADHAHTMDHDHAAVTSSSPQGAAGGTPTGIGNIELSTHTHSFDPPSFTGNTQKLIEDASGSANHGIVRGTPTISSGVLECDGVDANNDSQGVIGPAISSSGMTSARFLWRWRMDSLANERIPAAYWDRRWPGGGGAGVFRNGLYLVSNAGSSDLTLNIQDDGTSILSITATGAAPVSAGFDDFEVDLTGVTTGSTVNLKKNGSTVASGTLSGNFPVSTELTFTAGRITHGPADASSPFPVDAGFDSASFIRNGVTVLDWQMTEFMGHTHAWNNIYQHQHTATLAETNMALVDATAGTDFSDCTFLVLAVDEA